MIAPVSTAAANRPGPGTLPPQSQCNANILWLPCELMQQIGRHLGNDVFLLLAASCRTTRYALREDLAWRRAAHLIVRARTEPAWRRALAAAGVCEPVRQADLYRLSAQCAAALPKALRMHAADLLLQRTAPLWAPERARMAIVLLSAFQHRYAHKSGPLLVDVEQGLHEYMHAKSSPRRPDLMPGYLSAIRALPDAYRDAAYWAATVSTFRPCQAADTLAKAMRWLFPVSDDQRCEASFRTLLDAAEAMQAIDGETLRARTRLLTALMDTLYAQQPRFWPDRSRPWEMLYATVLALPVAQQGALLCKLAQGLDSCSIGLPAIRRHWEMLLEAANRLPPVDLSQVLCALVRAFGSLGWCTADGAQDSDDDASGSEHSDANDSASGYFEYGNAVNPKSVQHHHPCAQAAIAGHCLRLLDSAAGLPTDLRRAVRAEVSSMLAERLPFWNPEPLEAVRARLGRPDRH